MGVRVRGPWRLVAPRVQAQPAQTGRYADRGRLPREERSQPDGRSPRDAARWPDPIGGFCRRRRSAVSVGPHRGLAAAAVMAGVALCAGGAAGLAQERPMMVDDTTV